MAKPRWDNWEKCRGLGQEGRLSQNHLTDCFSVVNELRLRTALVLQIGFSELNSTSKPVMVDFENE